MTPPDDAIVRAATPTTDDEPAGSTAPVGIDDAHAIAPDAPDAVAGADAQPDAVEPGRTDAVADDASFDTDTAFDPDRRRDADPIAELAPDPAAARVEAPAPAAAAAPEEDPAEVVPAEAPNAAAAPAAVEPTTRAADPAVGHADVVLEIRGLTKRYGGTHAVDGIDLSVRAGSFTGLVGPNGAGKTTTLSMVTGLLRPDGGTVLVHGIDVWAEPERAKRAIGVLPDALRLFDRLSGAQLLYYSGVLRGLDDRAVRERSADLIAAFGLEDAAGRLVADYSAGMTKKIALACAMIHSPRLLVLDEPFESVDPVSSANIVEILQRYTAAGGTVVLSSHGMDLVQRVCDSVAIVVAGKVLAVGTMEEVRQGRTLEERFVELAGGRRAAAGMEWLHSFTD